MVRKTTEYDARHGGKQETGASFSMRPTPSLESEAKGASFAEFAAYADNPEGFASAILGSTWWQAQREIALLVAQNRRVAVKAANGVGKTYLAADLVLWFLYCHQPSVVLTTAPTWRQVESLLWEEIRRRHRYVNVLAEVDPAHPKLEGSLLQTRLKIAEGYFAMGLSTDEPVRFQGFHAENLLIVLDEACGVPEEIWDAVEGVCVGGNNRVLAISNPLSPNGRFYGLFKSPRWKTYTISALTHPNVADTTEGRRAIPGAVTREAVMDRVADWCERDTSGEENAETENETVSEGAAAQSKTETFLWEGKRYRPNARFRARVLGEFPESAEDSLFSLQWIEDAMRQEIEQVPQKGEANDDGRCVLAVDVARFGSDETVLAVRHGNVVTKLTGYQGLDTMAIAGRVLALAKAENAEIVAVDEIGVGGGVVDRLRENGLDGLVPINFGHRPAATKDADHFLNLRAQTYWELRDRIAARHIRLPKDETLAAQLAELHYLYSSQGLIQIESKDEMRRRGIPSPDRADAVAMLFCPAALPGLLGAVSLLPAGIHDGEDLSPVRWMEIGRW